MALNIGAHRPISRPRRLPLALYFKLSTEGLRWCRNHWIGALGPLCRFGPLMVPVGLRSNTYGALAATAWSAYGGEISARHCSTPALTPYRKGYRAMVLAPDPTNGRERRTWPGRGYVPRYCSEMTAPSINIPAGPCRLAPRRRRIGRHPQRIIRQGPLAHRRSEAFILTAAYCA